MASIVASQRKTTTIRSPGSGYGIQVSACVQASNDAARNAGQTDGMSKPDGHRASSLVAAHRIAMAAVPYSIGQPASAAVVTGSVNMRAGYIDWRAARSPSRPKGEHRQEIGERRRQRHDHHERKTLGAIEMDRLPGKDQELDRRENDQIRDERDQSPAMPMPEFPGDGGGGRAHAVTQPVRTFRRERRRSRRARGRVRRRGAIP